MLTIEQIALQIAPIAKKYDIARIELFGSYANGTNAMKSDVDFLVEFNQEIPSIFDVCGFQDEAKKKLSVDVDIVTLPIVNPDRLTIERSIPIYVQSR